jgi:hypothetical protein
MQGVVVVVDLDLVLPGRGSVTRRRLQRRYRFVSGIGLKPSHQSL